MSDSHLDELYSIVEMPAIDRVHALRRGIRVRVAASFARDLGFTLDQLREALCVDTWAGNSQVRLSPIASERILSVFRLVLLVESLIERSGDPRGFSAVNWLSAWLRKANPVLGRVPPVELLDTDEGMRMLARLISQMESGVHA